MRMLRSYLRKNSRTSLLSMIKMVILMTLIHHQMKLLTLNLTSMKVIYFLFNSLVSTLQQRLKNVNTQPRNLKDLFPSPLYLLTKRTKRCKTCSKFVVKPNINPTSNEPLKVDFQLIYHVPKVVIYRIGKYTEGAPFEVLIKFSNPNMSIAKVTLFQLDPSEHDEEFLHSLTA